MDSNKRKRKDFPIHHSDESSDILLEVNSPMKTKYTTHIQVISMEKTFFDYLLELEHSPKDLLLDIVSEIQWNHLRRRKAIK